VSNIGDNRDSTLAAEKGWRRLLSMKRKLVWILLLLLAGALAYWVYGKPVDAPAQTAGAKHAAGGRGRPLPVQAASATTGDIDVVIDALGTVTARNTATVKARVDGQLLRVGFQEGQAVKAGALLAEIDPRPFQVVFDQAKGQLRRDRALLANARLDLTRYRGLLAQDSIAGQQVDDQKALVEQYEGLVQADLAQVESARLQLDFTRITAPISGRLGLRQVDVGNMIHGSDANGLVVITETQPINVVFAIPADNIAAVLAGLRKGAALAVDVYDRVGKVKLASGKLLTVDNQVDVTTGTVKLKAEFANRDEQLFPNQFVNARLRLETRHSAILVPVAAIQRGTQGPFVYLVGHDQTVSIRPVTLGPFSGDVVAVDQGLATGDLVVIDGADKLRDGALIAVTTPTARDSTGKAAPVSNGNDAAAAEERTKRWLELDARIDRGEFGEEIRKLSEEERKQRMGELRRQREGGGSG